MGRYIVKRLLYTIPVLFIVSVVIFLIVHLTPGSPAAAILGIEASQDQINALNQELGFDQPLPQQYINWLIGVVQFDWGRSVFMRQSVLSSIFSHLGPTLSLAIIAQFFSVLFAIPLGVLAAKNHGGKIDSLLMSFSLVGLAIPSFLLGLLLMLLIGVQLRWLPVSGFVPINEGIIEHLRHLILPAIALGSIQVALIARVTRSEMIDVLGSQYIQTARAQGIKPRFILFKYALRNAMLPIITVIGQSFATLVTGAIVVESIFNIPGMGQLILNAITRRDYPVIQGVVLFITLFYVFINLAIDLFYGVIDPRVRLEKD